MKAQIASISILVLLTVDALALGGKIGSPQIGHPTGIDKAQLEKVFSLLKYMKDDLKFIEGSFINEFSSQRFDGTSEKVSRFIGLLKEAEVWEVKVRFRNFGEQEAALTLDQNSSNKLILSINSGRDNFLLKDFADYLP